MHALRRPLTAIGLTVLSLILLLSGSFAFLIVSPLGGRLLLHFFKQQFACLGLVQVGSYEGSLHRGFVLKDIYVKGLTYVPNALLRIQKVEMRLPLWDLAHSDFKIFNARLFLPDSDPIVFTGDVFAGAIRGNLYAKSVDLHEAGRFWAIEDLRRNLQGFIANADLAVSGPVSAPVVRGHFLADSLRYKSIFLTDGFARLGLTLTPRAQDCLVSGEVDVDSGLVKIRGVDLDVTPSRFTFQGDFFNPLLQIHLSAQVEDMDIDLTVQGSMAKPDLAVSSDPPMNPQEALRVLFTHNAWTLSSNPFNGATSSQLAENFLNYSLQDLKEEQPTGFKTRLTNNLKLGLEMDQLPSPPGATNVYYTRKINGEMDMDENMSLNISQGILPQNRDPSQSTQDGQTETETQIYWQYKKRF